MHLRLAIMVAAWCLPAALRAQSWPAEAPGGLYVADGTGGMRQTTQLATSVDIEVTGVVARVSVSQRFRNDSGDGVEGVYVFPLPENSAVDRLRMRIGDRFIEGKVKEREAARKL